MSSDFSNELISSKSDNNIPFLEERSRFLCEQQNNSCLNRSKSSKSYQFKDRFLPGKISSQKYQILLGVRSSSKKKLQCLSVDKDINDQLRIESSVVEYRNLLRHNILEDEQIHSRINQSSFHEENNYEQKPERSLSKGKGVLNYSKTNKRYKPYFYGNGNQGDSIVQSEVSPIRKIAKQPFKILDAPKLRDDFYNSVLDWSSGNQIAIGLENTVYTWNAITNEATKLMEITEPFKISSLSWCRRQEILAVGDDQGKVKIFDVEKQIQLRIYDNHDQRVGTLDWNGQIVTSGSRDGNIFLNDVRCSRSLIMQFTGHRQEVCGLKWSPSEVLLASGGNDNKVIVNSLLMPKKPQSSFKDHVAAVKALSWSPHQSNILASGGGTNDKTLKFWNVANNSLIQSVDTGSQICNMTWSTNTDELVTTHGFSHTQQNQIAIWQVADKAQKIATLGGHTFRVLYLAISPDGENIVTGSGDETIRFWKAFPARKKFPIDNKFSQLDSMQIKLR